MRSLQLSQTWDSKANTTWGMKRSELGPWFDQRLCLEIVTAVTGGAHINQETSGLSDSERIRPSHIHCYHTYACHMNATLETQ